MAGYVRMVERSCHWNCYRPEEDFFPPPPPKFWAPHLYTAEECAAWCDSMPGCTGFEYPTGCAGEPGCAAYPDKSTPGSYCGLFFRGMCSSAASPGFHVSPGFDTFVRQTPAAPKAPYYAFSEQLAPTPLPSGVQGAAPEPGSRERGLPEKVAALLERGRGFGHLEELLEMQLAMRYPIFFNSTALQPGFPLYRARVSAEVRQVAWDFVSNLTVLLGAPPTNAFAGWTVAGALLLMLQLYDETHEIVLGNQPLLPQSEVWDWLHIFQSRPQDYWLYRPMSPENHYLHAILHRIEGHRRGEAGLIGFDNAKYWFAGGVEQPPWGLDAHPVYAELAAAAREHEPLRRCCIFSEAHHVIVPPGRQVRVAPGWDPFAFVDYYRSVVEGALPRAEDVAAVRWAQRTEFELLFNHSLRLALLDGVDPYLGGWPERVPVRLAGRSFGLWAQRWGRGAVKVLLLHGGPGCSHMALDSLAGLLDPAAYELFFFDQLGGGRSDCADPAEPCHRTMPAALGDFVEQVEQVRRHFRLPAESTLLLGHSWGVVLAIEHALRHPGAFRGYVLAGFPASLAAQMRRMDALRGQRHGFFGRFICRARPCPASMVACARHCNEHLVRRLLWTDGGFACTGALCGWDREADLHRIAAPALLIVGGHDIAAPADVRRMAERMPRATFVELPGAGHAEFIDDAPGFLGNFSAWVRGSALAAGPGACAEAAAQGRTPSQPSMALACGLALTALCSLVAARLRRPGTKPGVGARSPMLLQA